ncbi:hypothetical protein ABW19_dt0204705 [Dactylella cylindrospora]|nr:hypothetical protein ABW19_dt0204705 [Dactylella cylindrospora]
MPSYDSTETSPLLPPPSPDPSPPKPTPEGDTTLPTDSPLGRTLDWPSAYILSLSRVLGSGIFAVPGVLLKSVGSVGLSLTLWLVGAVVVSCGLAVSLEYGCMLPRSGGDKVYLEYTYQKPKYLASVMIATQAVFLGFTASNSIVFSQYVHWALGFEEAEGWTRKALAVGLVSTVTVVHGVWYRAGVRIQNFLGWVKVGLIVFMVVAAVYVVGFRREVGSRGYRPVIAVDKGEAKGLTWDGIWEGSDWGFGTISTSLFKVFYCYAGLDNLNKVLNEVKNPVKTLRSVSITALITACLLYILANLAYLAVVPLDEIKSSGQLVAALFFERTFGATLGKRFLSLAVALSAAGNVMVVAFAHARLNQEIAKQGFLPFSRIFASSKPFGTPLGGLIVIYIPTVLVITLPPSKEVYSFILEVEGYPAQVYAAAISIGLIWLRYKKPDLNRPFRAWIPAVVFRIVLCFALLAAPFFPPKDRRAGGLWYATYAVVGVAILLLGVLYWLIWTVVLPKLGNYQLVEKQDILDDGTPITVLEKVPNDELVR